MKNGFIESGGVKIHYLMGNSHDPEKLSLLFVPGIMMPAWIWERQLEYFSNRYNVIAMDPRSHGDSALSTEGHDAFSMAQDIRTVVESLHLDSLVLIGWSLGVPQVVNYAAHFGKKLAGLVLVDGIVGADSSLSFYQLMINQWMRFQMDRIPNTRKFIKSIFKQPQREEYLEKLFEVAMRMPTNTAMTLIYNYILQDFRPLLPQIQIPVFIATVEGQRLNYMLKMKELFPEASLEIFADAGHALFVDQPEHFNRSLGEFLLKIQRQHDI